MAIKISEMTLADLPLTGTEEVELSTADSPPVTRRTTVQDIADLAAGGAGDALTSNPLSQFAATTSAQLASVISDETGSGALVLATSPTLVTPALGTPTALVLTNATGLPVAGGGTGVATLTAYAPVFGGTTGTAAVQSGTVGTSGQVLTSNGAGALPTFQAAGGGSPTSITGTTGASGGNATATGGTSTTSANAGGQVVLLGGTPGVTGVGGAVSVTGGAGGTTSGAGGAASITGGVASANSQAGGAVTITGGGVGSTTSTGGAVTVAGANAQANPGALTLNGGSATNSGTGAAVSITGGTGISGAGGVVTVTAGATSGGGTTGAAVTVTGGIGAAINGAGGAVNLVGGRGGLGSQSFGGVGGAVNLTGGQGDTGDAGGLVKLTGGLGGATGVGGKVQLIGGAAGGGNKNGGDVGFKGGAPTGTGSTGNVILNDTGAALATTATGGFTCIPTCAGTPTGVPASIPTGTVPVVYDTTNAKFYAYTSAAWTTGAALGANTFTGAQTAPSFIPNSSTIPTNGVYLPAANSVGISTNTTLAVTVDASQKVGIGGTSGGAKLEVLTGTGAFNGVNTRFNSSNAPIGFGVANSNGFAYLANNAKQVSGADTQTYDITAAATRVRMDSGAFVFNYAASGTAGNAITWSESMRIDSSGNVGVGRTPSAVSVFRSVEIGPAGGLVLMAADNNTNFYTNAYFNGTNFTRIATGETAGYRQINGIHTWFSNSSGAAASTFAETERMRIDASGKVGIGVTPTEVLHTNGNILMQNLTGASGSGVLRWQGSGGTNQAGIASYFNTGDTGNLEFLNGTTTNMQLSSAGILTPGADNTQNLGSASKRWKEVFAGTGTINTSDAREKTAVTPLTKVEVEATKRLAKEIGTYQWLEAVTLKGDEARQHIGLTVQRAIEILSGLGLDATRYGFICYDEWSGGDRYSFRHDELLLFLARGFDARLAALESAQ